MNTYEVTVQLANEGYSARRVRVEAASSDEAKKRAIEEYAKHLVTTGEVETISEPTEIA